MIQAGASAFSAALKTIALVLSSPGQAVLFLRRQENLVAVCLVLILLRCIFELPATNYNWAHQPGDLKATVVPQLLYWLFTHPLSLFIGVFVSTLVYFLTTPWLWWLMFNGNVPWHDLRVAYTLMFAVMVVVGPLFRLSKYTLSLSLEALAVTVLMAIAFKLSTGRTWLTSIAASFTVEAVWILAVLLVFSYFTTLSLSMLWQIFLWL